MANKSRFDPRNLKSGWPVWVAAAAALVFGLVLLIFGLGEIVNLFRSAKVVRVPWPLYVGPVITLALGIVMFFFPDRSGNAVFVIFGATLLLYSVSEFASTYTIRREMKNIAEEMDEN